MSKCKNCKSENIYQLIDVYDYKYYGKISYTNVCRDCSNWDFNSQKITEKEGLKK